MSPHIFFISFNVRQKIKVGTDMIEETPSFKESKQVYKTILSKKKVYKTK